MKASGVFILVAALLWVGWGYFERRTSEGESRVILRQLKEQLSDVGTRPSPDEVRIAVAVGPYDRTPAFPEFPGVRLHKFGASGDTVELVYAGEARATGWCFDASYEGETAPIVSRVNCSY